MRDCVVVGVGQLGRLFGSGALACGARVTPIVRGGGDDDASDAFGAASTGAPILVTVGERDLAAAIGRVPKERAGDVVLVQNELFPAVWRALLPQTVEPTVVVVWSNVKKGRPVEVGRATAAFGTHAAFVGELHRALDIPFTALRTFDALTDELVAKYAFILAVNALGLEKQRTVGEWLDADAARVDDVVARYVGLGLALAGRGDSDPSATAAVAIAKDAMRALRAMPAAGRTARERVGRAKAEAARLGVAL